MPSGYSLVTLAIFVVVLIGIAQAIRVVPQQRAWVVERLGRFHAVLAPGLNFVVPFRDRVAYRHDLRETAWLAPSASAIRAGPAGRGFCGRACRRPRRVRWGRGGDPRKTTP